MTSYHPSIADPTHLSFESQLCITERSIELTKIRKARYEGKADLKYLYDPCVEGIAIAEKQAQILRNLIALYGGNPGKRDSFIATVYGDRDPYYFTDDILKLPDEYKLGLRPYGNKYIADEFSIYCRFYVPDGTGKYKYIGLEKKL